MKMASGASPIAHRARPRAQCIFVPTDPNNAPHTVDTLLRVIAQRDAEVALLKLTIDKLKLQLLRRARVQFGRSSEQLDDAQLALIAAEPARSEPAHAASLPRADRKQRREPRKLPEHLPRETHVHLPKGHVSGQPCACSECGGKLRQIGEDVSEVLEYVPARFKVIRHVRPKLACAGCQSIVQAGAPSRPIARGLPGPGLLAHVLVAKYADHLPLYRQSASTRAKAWSSSARRWPIGSATAARCSTRWWPRWAATRWAAASCTPTTRPCRCSTPAAGKPRPGGCGSMCATIGPAAATSRRRCGSGTRPTARASVRREHLKHCGILQADAYAGFGKLYDSGAHRGSGLLGARPAQLLTYDSQGRASGSVAERRCSASARSTRSKPRSAASPPTNDDDSGKRAPGRCWRRCTPG